LTCHVALRNEEFVRRLRHDRRDVCRALAATEAELVDRGEHHPRDLIDDAATDATCHVLASLEERDRRRLAKVEAAEERLSGRTFGSCERCTRPIPRPRLRAMPTARLCVACAETAERGHKEGRR
jgi:DnaK suppressor protein